MRDDLPRTRTILDKIEHGPTAISLTVEHPCEPFTPGQFVMVWLPRVDEKPFSVSRYCDGLLEVTVRRLGPVSERIADLEVGDRVGVRGPYGRGYSIEPDCCIVAGGVGLAAVAPLIERFPEAPVLYGENTAANLILVERFPKMRVFTVDGSRGEKGFPTDALPSLLAERRPRIVYGCGPEIMLAKVARLCGDAGVAAEISLERYMKCAMGVCGQCCMDGARVCVDGPVFRGSDLLEATDFGFRRLDKSGTWVVHGARGGSS